MREEGTFKSFYQFMFEYAKENPGNRTIDKSAAAYLWQEFLLVNGRFPLITAWLEFLETIEKGISKDTWSQLLTFSDYAKKDPTLEAYDMEGMDAHLLWWLVCAVLSVFAACLVSMCASS